MTQFRDGLLTDICLIDSPDVKRDGDNVKVYTSEAVQNTPGVSLTRGGMMLIALLSGGDYDEVCDRFSRMHLLLTLFMSFQGRPGWLRGIYCTCARPLWIR